MLDLRLAVFTALTVLATSVTLYSAIHDIHLDTSNPLLTHLPHPLSKTHYFASKANFLNVYFIKKAWAWTTAAFFLSWLTSPPSIRTRERVLKWAAHTTMWVVFTAWFFGPAILERLIVASGGECVLALPSGGPITVPVELCFTKSHLSPSSHPELFGASSSFTLPVDWRAIPRLRRGHDVSGHVFLLTMATLFLTDQLRYSLRLVEYRASHAIAVAANVVMILIWFFATYTTCLYFHTPLEKITGFSTYQPLLHRVFIWLITAQQVLGASCFAITLLPEVEAAEKRRKAEKMKQSKEN